jgi:tetratricopeptide (TPR) repeat protein
MVPDEDLTNYAYALARSERYIDALATLDLLQNPRTAVALNYRGFATRKLGRLDEGIGYYLQAVEVDPAYPQVREYLGEAYVTKGRLDLAKEQLVVIASLCGTTCESYVELAEAIEAAK